VRLEKILLSRAIRFGTGSTPAGSVYLPHLARVMQDRYRFIQVPTKLEEYDSTKGIKFFHGVFEGAVIESAEIYNDGVAVVTRANTRDADEFIDDLFDLALREFSYHIVKIPNLVRNYNSELEVIFEKNLDEAFSKFRSVIDNINRVVASYSVGVPPFQPTGLLIHCDLTQSHFLKPLRFGVERRIGYPFDSNLYYSTAPLPTDDHLASLEELERLI
jgi:hypothetical protein